MVRLSLPLLSLPPSPLCHPLLTPHSLPCHLSGRLMTSLRRGADRVNLGGGDVDAHLTSRGDARGTIMGGCSKAQEPKIKFKMRVRRASSKMAYTMAPPCHTFNIPLRKTGHTPHAPAAIEGKRSNRIERMNRIGRRER